MHVFVEGMSKPDITISLGLIPFTLEMDIK